MDVNLKLMRMVGDWIFSLHGDESKSSDVSPGVLVLTPPQYLVVIRHYSIVSKRRVMAVVENELASTSPFDNYYACYRLEAGQESGWRVKIYFIDSNRHAVANYFAILPLQDVLEQLKLLTGYRHLSIDDHEYQIIRDRLGGAKIATSNKTRLAIHADEDVCPEDAVLYLEMRTLFVDYIKSLKWWGLQNFISSAAIMRWTSARLFTKATLLPVAIALSCWLGLNSLFLVSERLYINTITSSNQDATSTFVNQKNRYEELLQEYNSLQEGLKVTSVSRDLNDVLLKMKQQETFLIRTLSVTNGVVALNAEVSNGVEMLSDLGSMDCVSEVELMSPISASRQGRELINIEFLLCDA